MLSVQEKGLTVRETELSLGEAKDKRNFEYAREALQAKTRLEDEGRKASERIIKWVIVAGGLTFFGVAGLVCILVHLGQSELVKQGMYYVVTLLGGGAGGYSIRTIQTSKSE